MEKVVSVYQRADIVDVPPIVNSIAQAEGHSDWYKSSCIHQRQQNVTERGVRQFVCVHSMFRFWIILSLLVATSLACPPAETLPEKFRRQMQVLLN